MKGRIGMGMAFLCRWPDDMIPLMFLFSCLIRNDIYAAWYEALSLLNTHWKANPERLCSGCCQLSTYILSNLVIKCFNSLHECNIPEVTYPGLLSLVFHVLFGLVRKESSLP